MSKIKAEIWGREFELPIIVKKFSGEDSTETQREAVERFKNNLQLINAAKPEVEKYILENGLKDNGNSNSLPQISALILLIEFTSVILSVSNFTFRHPA